jgi:hypothetical protein
MQVNVLFLYPVSKEAFLFFPYNNFRLYCIRLTVFTFVVNTLYIYFRLDSASNRNEYQEYFLGVKAAGA